MARKSPPGIVRRVSVDTISENALSIRQSLNLSLLLPKLQDRGVFSPEQLQQLSDPRHTEIERTGYLLQFVIRLQQRGVDGFISSLRETDCEPHRRIVETLEELSEEIPAPSPLLEVLETKKKEIVSRLSFTTFLNKMREMGEVTVQEAMDVHNPHRSLEENTLALVELLAVRPGAQGLLKFIECLQQDPNPGHTELASTLLREAEAVVREHPQRTEIPQGDRTQLVQLERWMEVGTPSDVQMRSTFRKHQTRLARELNVGSLLPHLLKKKVLSGEEEREINQLDEGEQAPRLVAMVAKKGMRPIGAFVECLRLSRENVELFHLVSAKKTPTKQSTEKTDKLAVMVAMDTFLWLKNDYEAEEGNMSVYSREIEDQREGLQTYLERVGFVVVDFGEVISAKRRERGAGAKPPAINTVFDKVVASRCKKDAVVFIYISGHQFPLKLKRENGYERYSGAVLTDGASVLSRRKCDCIDMSDLKLWVELLPTDYVTFLIDCHHSHVVSYGKQRLPSEVEIMESPWSALIGCHGVVLYFCQPDPEAMWRQRGTIREENSVFGKLTKLFLRELISWISRRRSHNNEISHRLIYEAISFHWHKNGREHELFVPAIQGDVDRSFLDRASYPYLQVLRADLVRSSAPSDSSPFDLIKLQVATGTHLGLIKDDELEVFHILRPEVRVSGRVTRAHPLSAIAMVMEEEREKLGRHLKSIYEEENESRDGSSEFVMVKKKFPLHLRDRFTVFCDTGVSESDEETVKNYIKNYSQLLSYARGVKSARMVVVKAGQFFNVEDREKRTGDEMIISFKSHVRTIQSVKSVLEIMAWFKYVKNMKTQTDLNHFLCYLVCEKPLLTKSSTISTDQHRLKASTQEGPLPVSEAVIHFSDLSSFWCPKPEDQSPTLEVEFCQNKVVTAVELRGDPDSGGHIREAELNYKKLVFTKDCTAPAMTKLSKILVDSQEKAWYVTLKPLEWEKGAEFYISLRILVSVPQARGEPKSKGLVSLSVMHWTYLAPIAGWGIRPQPIVDQQTGHGILDLGQTDNMLGWSGRSQDPLTFDLGEELQVHSIEIASVPGTKPLNRFRLELTTQWLQEPLQPFLSPWPTKQDLRPLVVSSLQLCPVRSEAGFRAQLQLYGNTHEKKVVAEERDILQLHFVNFTKDNLFVYLYYLEETGKIEVVFSDVVSGKNGLKKLIRVHIPEGYDPVAKRITDQYRVVVSPKKVYLEPLKQLGLHEYLGVRSYNPCSIGRRTDIGKEEQWHEYKFEVTVKKGSDSHN